MTEEASANQGAVRSSLVFRLEETCDKFEAAWRAAKSTGKRPGLEDYLGEIAEPERAGVLCELIALDIAYRRGAGEQPQLEEYVKRFPFLDIDQLASTLNTQPAADLSLPASSFNLQASTFRVGGPPLETAPRRIRCPHCYNPIQLADDRPDEVLCPACGSSFRLRETRQTTTMAEMRPLGKFQLLERVGVGAFGAVWRARDTELDRIVALKIPHASLLSSQADLERFRREARAVAQLRHPGIVTVHEVQILEGLPTLVADFIAGVPLKDLLEVRRLTFREATALIADVAEALDYAHTMGLVHRDIKPANIMLESVIRNPLSGAPEGSAGARALPSGAPLSESGLKPLIMDFGLALRQEAETTLTQDGCIVGTPAYMSPEQAAGKGHQADQRSDVYSLGVILYELLCGELPFRGSKTMMLHQVLYEEPRPPRRINDKIPRDLETICLRAMAKVPAQRYQTAREMAEDLRRFLAGEPIKARPVGRTERLWRWCRRNPALATLTALVALLLVLVATSSSIMSLRLNAALGLSEVNRGRAERAERNAKEKLWQSYRDQARAGRLSRRVGQRFESLAALKQATQLARELDLPEDRFLELRNEAIACLALIDLQPAKEWQGFPAGTVEADFDERLERYAWHANESSAVSVRRVADNQELYRLSAVGPNGGQGFSPDGQFLAVGNLHSLKLWRLAGPSAILMRDEQGCTAGGFSPDSRQFAFGRAEGIVDIYDLATEKQVRHLKVAPSPRHLAFHPSQKQIAIAYRDRACVYNLDTGTKVAEFLLAWDNWPYLAWHPDGKTLAAVGGERIIYLWDVPSGKQIAKLEGFRNGGISFRFSHGGTLLASTGWDGILRLWDPRTGRLLFTTPTGTTVALRFSPDDRFLAAQSIGETLRIWEVIGGREYHNVIVDLALDRGRHSGGSFRSDGRLLAIGSDDGVGLWDLASDKPAGFIPLSAGSCVLFEPSGALLANMAGGLWRWPVRADTASPDVLLLGPPQRLPLPGSNFPLARSRDGRVIASPQGWGAYVLHTDRNRPPIKLWPHADARQVAVSPDGRWVATGSHGGSSQVKVWDAETGRLVTSLFAGAGHHLAFSPDGQWLATSGDSIRVWEVFSWRTVQHFKGGTRGKALAFSPDSRLLAFETGDAVVCLVDPATGKQYGQFEDPEQQQAGVLYFSPDGTQLVALGYGQSGRVWDLRAIRQQLATLDLDWDLPPYPPVDKAKPSGPLQVQANLGNAFELLSPATNIAFQSLLLAMNPFNFEAYLHRGRSYGLLRQSQKAIADYHLALALMPPNYKDRGEALFRRSNNYRNLSDAGNADADLQTFAELDLDLPLDLCFAASFQCNNLAWHYVTGPEKERQPSQALALARKAVQLTPDLPMWWNTLGVVYYRLGRYMEAIEALQRSMRENDPEEKSAGFDLFFLAMCHARLGDAALAKDCYERAVHLVHEHAEQLQPGWKEELDRFRAEAEGLLRPQGKP